MADTIIRVVHNGSTYDLDIDSNIPLRVDASVVENTRIGNYFGVGSQKFNLPGTKNNNKFFQHGYNVAATDIPAFYNTIPGYVISNGETLLDGQFQLIEVITDQDGYTTYSCRITDNVVKFNDAVASKLISEADWSDLDHNLTYYNITQSWSDNLVNGDVFYPMVEYGFDNPDNIQLPWFSFSGSVGNYLSNTLTPMQAQQFLPAVRVSKVLDKIFDQVGFRYTGSFQQEDTFEQLYILPKAQDSLGIVGEPGDVGTCFINNSANITIPPTASTSLPFDTVVTDPTDAFNETSGYYTTSGIGDYAFSVNTSFFNPAWFGGSVTVTLRLMIGTFSSKSGTVIASQTVNLDSSYGFNTVNMNAAGSTYSSISNEVWAEISYVVNSGSPGSLSLLGIGTYFRCTEAPAAVVGANVNMGLQFNSQTKSIDILNGIIQQFNLVLTPVKGENNVISIDTFDNWIRTGEVKDWTDKWNTSQRISINHTVDEQPKQLLLKATDDADRFSKAALESEPNYQYGTLRLLADNNLSQGQKTIGDYFAPVVLGGPFDPTSTGTGTSGDGSLRLDYSNNFIFPHLYKYENSQITSYAFKPRIGYKVTNNFTDTFYIGDPGSTTAISGSYATIANVSSLPVVQNETKDLLFNNTYTTFTYTNDLDESVSGYDAYYKTYLDSLYWEDSVKVTLDIEFSEYEYYNINLNDKIFIKDTFYRINKITGYNLSQKDIATVELIKLYPQYFDGIVVPGTCDFTISALESSLGCAGGPTPTPFATSTPTPTPTATSAGPSPTPTIPPTATPVPTAGPTSTPIPPTATPIPPTSTPPTTYYARFVTCDDPGGLIIQVSDSSPIPTSGLVLSDGLECYTWYSSGGTGVDGDIDTFTQYASCAACGVTPTPTPVPTSTPVPCNQLAGIYGSTVSAEDAYCTTTKQSAAYFNSYTLGTSTQVYSDSNCTTLRSIDTWYSDQISLTRFWDASAGTLTTVSNPACP